MITESNIPKKAVRWALESDDIVRKNPHVRIYAALLVEHLAEIIEGYAWELASLSDQEDAQTLDTLGEILWWQLIEFGTNTDIDRVGTPFETEYYTEMRHFHQLNANHCHDHFNVDHDMRSLDFWQVIEDGKIVADERDHHRQWASRHDSEAKDHEMAQRQRQREAEREREIAQVASLTKELVEDAKQIDALERRIADLERKP